MRDQIVALLGPDDVRDINRLLQEFVAEAGARCALLLDRSGRPVTAFGDTGDIDETSFASLAAADFDASDELAGLLGEAEFSSLYHQGVDGSMYLSDVDGAAILAAIFDGRTTLGMVRLKTRQVVPRLVDRLDRLRGQAVEAGALDADFAHDAASQIDRLFAG